MITKVNILFDGGFFEKKFKEKNKKNPTAEDVEKETRKIMSLVTTKTSEETKDVLFRVYYYDCKPFDKEISSQDGQSKIDFSKSNFCKTKEAYIKNLCNKDKFTVRLGEISFDGWKQDKYSDKWKPDFKQKGVDMKFGLDMALMALKHTVDKIVLVAGDADFIAPINLVKEEGVQVYLYSMGHKIKSQLAEISDFKLS